MGFILDSRLEESSFYIDDWPLCRVALRNDKTYPWIYLVPRRDGVIEIDDLSVDERQSLIEEIVRAVRGLSQVYDPAKVNTAALGNIVPQLHIHVFGRFTTDPAWPKPVWAVQADEIPYTVEERDAELEKLKRCFAAM